jgi:hypothetical protein
MNFGSLNRFNSILEMNKELEIKICTVGPIRQDGPSRGRKRPAQGPAKLDSLHGLLRP